MLPTDQWLHLRSLFRVSETKYWLWFKFMDHGYGVSHCKSLWFHARHYSNVTDKVAQHAAI